jgi:hypothetical protein
MKKNACGRSFFAEIRSLTHEMPKTENPIPEAIL